MSTDANQTHPEAPETPSNDSSTLAKLVSTVANLEATVAGSLQTAAANIKQSVEMMGMFNQMMEAYLMKAIVINILPGRVEAGGDKTLFRFDTRVQNVGSFAVPGVQFDVTFSTGDGGAPAVRVDLGPGEFSVIPASDSFTIPCSFELPASLSCIQIDFVAFFSSPGTGNTLKVSAQRQIPQIELLRLAARAKAHPNSSPEQEGDCFSIKVDALKLRKLFKVAQSRGLAEYEYHFGGDKFNAVAHVQEEEGEQEVAYQSSDDDKITLSVHGSNLTLLRDALASLE